MTSFFENSVRAFPGAFFLLPLTGLFFYIFLAKNASFFPFSGSVLRFCNAYPAKISLKPAGWNAADEYAGERKVLRDAPPDAGRGHSLHGQPALHPGH
ncbi:MAG: hypothetical protein IJQ33_03880 [Clostridia bacterium]|nr:hypothetical protein [Clostridia bacterium]